MRPPVISLVLLSGGLAAGYLVGLPRAFRQEVRSLVKAATPDEKPAPVPAGKASSAAPDLPEASFLARLDACGVDDFAAFFAEVRRDREKGVGLPGDSLQEVMILERWAEVDPEAAAIAAVEAGGHSLGRAVFRVWALTDPAGAMKAMQDKTLLFAGVGGFFLAAGSDPGANLVQLKALAEAGLLSFTADQAAGEYTFFWRIMDNRLPEMYARDPDACRALVEKMPPWFGRRLDMLKVLAAAQESPERAIEQLAAAAFGKEEVTDLLVALQPLALAHPDRCLSMIEHLTAKLGPGWMQLSDRAHSPAFFASLAKAAPDRIREILQTAGSNASQMNGHLDWAARELFSENPALALQLAPVRSSLDQVNGWKISGPHSARDLLGMVESAPFSGMRLRVLQQGLDALSAESPEAAAAWLAALPDGELKASAADILAHPGRPAALTALAQLSFAQEVVPREAVETLVFEQARLDSAAAAAQVLQLPEGDTRNAGVMHTGRVWAEMSTSEALEWTATLGNHDRSMAVAGILETWARSEPAAAAEYLANLPEGVSRDLPACAFSASMAAIHPESALEWAATIVDPNIRQDSLGVAASAWWKESPEEAKAGMTTVPGLTDAERQQFSTPTQAK